jgi:isochorismate pyruvate lyase
METMQNTDPSACSTMAQVRQCIDDLDMQIVALLAQRTSFMTQAARIKEHQYQVRDNARVDYIVQRVGQAMQAQGFPPQIAQATYQALIEQSIAFEEQEFSRLRQGVAP